MRRGKKKEEEEETLPSHGDVSSSVMRISQPLNPLCLFMERPISANLWWKWSAPGVFHFENSQSDCLLWKPSRLEFSQITCWATRAFSVCSCKWNVGSFILSAACCPPPVIHLFLWFLEACWEAKGRRGVFLPPSSWKSIPALLINFPIFLASFTSHPGEKPAPSVGTPVISPESGCLWMWRLPQSRLLQTKKSFFQQNLYFLFFSPCNPFVGLNNTHHNLQLPGMWTERNSGGESRKVWQEIKPGHSCLENPCSWASIESMRRW